MPLVESERDFAVGQLEASLLNLKMTHLSVDNINRQKSSKTRNKEKMIKNASVAMLKQQLIWVSLRKRHYRQVWTKSLELAKVT